MVFKHAHYDQCSCELWVTYSVLFVFQAEGSSANEIYCWMSVVYGEHCMVHQNGVENLQKVKQTFTINVVAKANLVDQVIREKQTFTIS